MREVKILMFESETAALGGKEIKPQIWRVCEA
jgi:hypothetical protein